jgi:hypothetical protein
VRGRDGSLCQELAAKRTNVWRRITSPAT